MSIENKNYGNHGVKCSCCGVLITWLKYKSTRAGDFEIKGDDADLKYFHTDWYFGCHEKYICPECDGLIALNDEEAFKFLLKGYHVD